MSESNDIVNDSKTGVGRRETYDSNNTDQSASLAYDTLQKDIDSAMERP